MLCQVCVQDNIVEKIIQYGYTKRNLKSESEIPNSKFQIQNLLIAQPFLKSLNQN